MNELIIGLLVVLFVGNVIILFLVIKKLKEGSKTTTQEFPKWEYFKDGIRFYNKKGQVTIQHDKPLK